MRGIAIVVRLQVCFSRELVVQLSRKMAVMSMYTVVPIHVRGHSYSYMYASIYIWIYMNACRERAG